MIRVTRRDRNDGDQTALKKQRVPLRDVYVWGVNSTVIKHSDYFVWKDMSERMARRYDDTSWQEASEFLCIKNTSFIKRVQQQKNSRENPDNAFSDMLTNVKFEKQSAAGAAKKQTALHAVV